MMLLFSQYYTAEHNNKKTIFQQALKITELCEFKHCRYKIIVYLTNINNLTYISFERFSKIQYLVKTFKLS